VKEPARTLIVYSSKRGHAEKLARAVFEGVRRTPSRATLAEASPEAINALTIQAVKPGAEGQPAGPPHRSSVPWGIAMGESAHTPTPAIESDGELLTRLRKETGSAGAALEQFKRLRG